MAKKNFYVPKKNNTSKQKKDAGGNVPKAEELQATTRNSCIMFLGVNIGVAVYFALEVCQGFLAGVWPLLAVVGGAALAEFFRVAYKGFSEKATRQTTLLASAGAFFVVGILAAQQLGMFANVLLAIGLGISLSFTVRFWMENKNMMDALKLVAFAFLGLLFGHSLENWFAGRGITGCSLLLLCVLYMLNFGERKR